MPYINIYIYKFNPFSNQPALPAANKPWPHLFTGAWCPSVCRLHRGWWSAQLARWCHGSPERQARTWLASTWGKWSWSSQSSWGSEEDGRTSVEEILWRWRDGGGCCRIYLQRTELKDKISSWVRRGAVRWHILYPQTQSSHWACSSVRKRDCAQKLDVCISSSLMTCKKWACKDAVTVVENMQWQNSCCYKIYICMVYILDFFFFIWHDRW